MAHLELRHLSLLSPAASLSPPWYKKNLELPTNDTQFEFFPGASTPLKVTGKQPQFISPMRRLDNFHLSASSPIPEKDEVEEGDLTIANLSSDDDPNRNEDDALDNCEDHHHSGQVSDESHDEVSIASSSILDHKPVFTRKRRIQLPLDMVITPGASDSTMVPMSGIETSKLGISSSESTPCPLHPRKRLRFRPELDVTPSQPNRTVKPVLNLSQSRKISAGNVPLLTKLTGAGLELESLPVSPPLGLHAGHVRLLTPISQSTPTNSRDTLPFTENPAVPLKTPTTDHAFIKPLSRHKYQTPQLRPTSAFPHRESTSMLGLYHLGDFTPDAQTYQIVGEFPVSAAGLMDEKEDVHVGDKRINDPYLASPESSDTVDVELLREKYLLAGRLPLLEHQNAELPQGQLLSLIQDGSSVRAFYEMVAPVKIVEFLRKERLRWHPDKWAGRQAPYDAEVLHSLTQVLNELTEEYRGLDVK